MERLRFLYEYLRDTIGVVGVVLLITGVWILVAWLLLGGMAEIADAILGPDDTGSQPGPECPGGPPC